MHAHLRYDAPECRRSLGRAAEVEVDHGVATLKHWSGVLAAARVAYPTLTPVGGSCET